MTSRIRRAACRAQLGLAQWRSWIDAVYAGRYAVGHDRLERVGGTRDEIRAILVELERRENERRDVTLVAASGAADTHAQPKEVGGSE